MIKEKKNKTMTTDENVLAMYLADISRIPLLSREEEDKVARAAVQGNAAARTRLINGNLRFVVNVAKKFQGQGIPLADLISEGNIGLIHALDRFDPDKGFRFISYAVWWIRQALLNALCERSRLIRLPVNRATDLVRIQKAKKTIVMNSGCEPETSEIARLLGMEESYIDELVAMSRDLVSLERQVSDGADSSTLGSLIIDHGCAAPDQELFKKALVVDINEMLDSLDSKEAEIIRVRFGLGMQRPLSLKEVGQMYNLSKERIRQIEKKALNHLQQPNRKAILAAYVA